MALLSRADPVLNHNFVVSLIDTSSVLATLGSAALSAVCLLYTSPSPRD